MELNENALDPIRKELCPELFIKNSEIVKSNVKNYIIDTIIKWMIAHDFSEKNIKSVYIIGSSVGYQYSETSDVDVSVEVDFEIGGLWTQLPNGNTLPGTKHPINFYLTKDKSDVEKSDAAYDLKTDKWLKKPNKEKLNVPMSYLLEIAKFFIAGIEERLGEYSRDKLELETYKKYTPNEIEIKQEELDEIISKKENEVLSDLDALYVAYHVIKGFRKEGFKEESEFDISIDINIKKPNFSVNNLVYKTLERFGYLDKLQKVVKEREQLLTKK